MSDADLDRRVLLKLLGGCAAAGIAGCAAETPREALARLFGLTGDEQAWLDALSQDEQQELYDLLIRSDAKANPRAVSLVTKLLGPRSRLFAFVGYPTVLDRRSVCDGLVRE